MFTIQVFIAVAVTVGVAAAVACLVAVAGAIFQRDPARAAKAHPLTIPPQHSAPARTVDTPARELVLR
jgi:hypothetical protein